MTAAHRDRRPRRGRHRIRRRADPLARALAGAAVIALGAAGMLAFRQPPPVPGAVLVADVVPAPVPVSAPAGDQRAEATDEARDIVPAEGMSVAALPAAPATGVEPIRLRIPATDGARAVDAPVIPGGTVRAWSPFLKQEVETFAVTDPRTSEGLATVTWWSPGPRVGELGPGGELSILLGHNSGRGTGAFDRVAELPVGGRVEVEGPDAQVVDLVVAEVRGGLPKDDDTALVAALSDPPRGAVSALVTCTGQLRSVGGMRSHADNTVVFLAHA